MKPCKCCGSTSAETTRSETQHYRADLMRIQCSQCGHSEPIHTWGVVSPEVALEVVLESGYSVITDKPGNGENERYESECLTIMKRNGYKSADQMTFEQKRLAHINAMRVIK